MGIVEVLNAALAAALGIGTLLVGAAIAWRFDLSRRAVAGVLAFGAGVLIATLTLDLVADAVEAADVWPVVIGFGTGAVLYVFLDQLVAKNAARTGQGTASSNVVTRRGGATPGGGLSIAVGSLLDGIPEALIIGLSALSGQIPVGLVVAIALSNVPEGLAGTVPLKKSGRPAKEVFGLWAGITVAAVLSATLGAAILSTAPVWLVAAVVAGAAGALLTMVANAMIPEAFEDAHWRTGLLVTLGFLVAFVLGEVL